MPHPKHGYFNAAGKKVPGVTTILGRFKESGALLHWAFEQGKAAQRGEIVNLYDTRDEAANLGTLVHAMVEAHIKGTPQPDLKMLTKEQLEKVDSAYGAYRKWESMTKLKIVAQEVSMISEVHQFGGTMDGLSEISGELSLADWKTSSGIYTDFLVQLGGYAILWEELNPHMPLVGGFHLCKFSKEHGDFSHHHWPNLDEAKEQFLLFRKAYDIDKQLKKRAA